MDLGEIVALLDGEVASLRADTQKDIRCACAADLMSDVLAFADSGSVLLTGLINPQVVRTAEMAGIQAIVFVRGKYPPAETVSLAEETGIPLFTTRYTMYEACGRLYGAGLVATGLAAPSSLPG